MRLLVFATAAVLAACSSTGAGPDAGLPDRITTTCFTATTGAACTDEATWCRTTDQCGVEPSFCRCSNGRLTCSTPYTAAQLTACMAPEGLSGCTLEGTGVCDQEPVGGGTCACHAGIRSCDNACDGCPTQPPSEGAACTAIHTCRYQTGLQCTCMGGTFHCGP